MKGIADYKLHLQNTLKDYLINSEINNPKISVIIPCFNTEKFIEDCLVSFIKQSFKDFEIICVNDGSTDSTGKILNCFAEADSRIKVINQENQGVSVARNVGMENSKGEYIAFIDSDDWVNEEYLEKLYNAVKKHDCDIAVSTVVRKHKFYQKYRVNYTEEKVYTTLQDKVNICRVPICCYTCGKLYRKEAILNLKFKEGVYFEDVIWVPQSLDICKTLVTVPDAIYQYRVNGNSIVKKIPSKKKQFDSYMAKKFAIKYLEERGVNISDKIKAITKGTKYFCRIPVIKRKESENTITTILFGCIPISKKKIPQSLVYKNKKSLFLFKSLDEHFYIELLKLIKISIKNNKSFKLEGVNHGVNNEGLETNSLRKEKLIVSLTTFPERIETVDITIDTLLNQTVKPDKLVLWLAEEQFPNKENDLPEKLLKLRESGLEIRWCEDLKSYKKLVPALREFPNDVIVTADDDLYYQKDWLESLYSEYLKDNRYIYTRRACGEFLRDNTLYVSPHYANNNYEPTFLNQLMGGAGTLYPPHSLNSDATNIELIKTLVPTHDDIYFWIMAILNNTRIKLIKNKDVNLYTVKSTQKSGLCKKNNKNNDGMSPAEAFKRVFEKYPEAYKLVEKESFISK